MNKRTFLKSSALLSLLAMLKPSQLFASYNGDLYKLPSLPFSFDALEPYIDKQTMEIHHGKHHQAYVTNLNKAVTGTEYEKSKLEKLFEKAGKIPVAIRNNGGGHYNHSLFWTLLTPNGKAEPDGGELQKAIIRDFKSFQNFKDSFTKAAKDRFGSGWAWLIVNKKGTLEVTSTSNQDNPLMDVAEAKGTPILALDVWEHAYYLKYQNKRADYVEAFWKIINWNEVERLYLQALKKKK
jgi:superoxide dismutase, Fe-Mn family